MTQTTTSRPRIAAIGLSESQIASVSVLCGPMRTASTLSEYLQSYNWTETDLTILVGSRAVTTQVRGNVLAIGVPSFTWTGHNEPSPFNQRDFSAVANTEREVQVSPSCPEFLERLAGELVMQLRRAEAPPSVLKSRGSPEGTVRSLIHTTSGWPVATLGMYSQEPDSDDGWTAIALALPEQANPLDWLRILLELLHQIDKDRVPHAPPRLSKPADWYTPQERELARQLTQIGSEIEHLDAERERIKTALIAAQEEADAGIRRCIWTDGEELVVCRGFG
ncbi:MAG: hypothetical protein F4Z31_01870 [Gemmatimonadetes bacterium]|nr:hypothetical protein [Gemmatimonadota bacterium]